MNVGFYSHHFTENNFSKVISKIPIATPEGVFPMTDLSAVSDMVISPLWATPLVGFLDTSSPDLL